MLPAYLPQPRFGEDAGLGRVIDKIRNIRRCWINAMKRTASVMALHGRRFWEHPGFPPEIRAWGRSALLYPDEPPICFYVALFYHFLVPPCTGQPLLIGRTYPGEVMTHGDGDFYDFGALTGYSPDNRKMAHIRANFRQLSTAPVAAKLPENFLINACARGDGL